MQKTIDSYISSVIISNEILWKNVKFKRLYKKKTMPANCQQF